MKLGNGNFKPNRLAVASSVDRKRSLGKAWMIRHVAWQRHASEYAGTSGSAFDDSDG